MSSNNAYERLVRPLLFTLDPETAHHLAIGLLKCASQLPAALPLLRIGAPKPTPKKLFGLTFPNPVGLAAGFDKNGVALPAWAALGFGFVEIGTVTAKAQPGNARPRIFRQPREHALINRLGFNNDGAAVVAARLAELRKRVRWPAIPVGINIGKSRATPMEEAAEDYLISFRQLRPFADYVVLNVSSPNTPGLRSLQEEEALAHLLRSVRDENRITLTPVLVKISPDLSLAELEQLIATCEANGVAGIVATNTTVDHTALAMLRDEAGGMSGAPLRAKATEIVRAIAAQSTLPIIAAGGIFDVDDAREKLDAGAALVQLYTGYVYRGPGLVREIVDALAITPA